MADYETEMCDLIKKRGCTYWDILAKTDAEKKLLARLKRTKLGKLCIFLYAEPSDSGFWEKGDTFASEVLYRVGYEIGHWYQDLDDYKDRPERYPDGITPRMIANAERWVREAERTLGTGRQEYFGGGTF